MEAATAKSNRPPRASKTVDDTDLALRLGSLMLCTLGSEGGAVIKTIDETGLNFPQMKALLALAGPEEGPLATVKSVSERLGISLASASRAVDDLVKRGLATRVEDAEDRRIRRVSLTDDGQGIADELFASRLVGLERFVASLSAAERRKLDAALEALIQRDDVGETYRTHRRRTYR